MTRGMRAQVMLGAVWAVWAVSCGGGEQTRRGEEEVGAQGLKAGEEPAKVAEAAPKPPSFCPDDAGELTRRAYRWCARKDGTLHGPFHVKDAAGQVVMAGTFESGQMTGEWAGFWSDGKQRWRAKVQGGLEHGEVEGWYPDGKPHYSLSFAQGKYEGAATYWYDNGQKSTEGGFVDNKPSGTWTFWHPNGQKAHELTYKSDGSTDIHKHWDERGKKSAAPAGRMPSKLVQPVVDGLESNVIECYKHARMIDNAEGKIVTQFTVDYAGDVTRISIFESDFKHPFMHKCLRRQVEGLRFPPNPWGPQPIIRSWSFGVQ